MEGSGTAPAAGKPSSETPPPNPTPNPTPNPPAPTPPANPPAAGGGNGGETAAQRRIRELNEAKNAAEARATDFENRLKEIERQQLSDADRVKAEKEDAEKRALAAEARATRLERGGWARSAASAVGFVDPEDAVAMVDLDSLDTETKVKNAVEKLKEQKPHLAPGEGQGQGQAGQVPPPGVPGFGNLGGVGQQQTPEVPIGPDGQPDTKLGLGRELLGALTGRHQ